jgi:PilZ domain-containing protein
LAVDAQPEGEALQNVFLSSRKEERIPFKMFVNLYSPDNPTFEVAPTIDISCHGVRVVTKTFWRPEQQVSVRGIRGKLYSRARVVHCQQHKDDSFVVGLELYYPEGDWTVGTKPPGNDSSDQPKPAL